jgi:cytoskeletal protein RodZ
MVRSPGESPAPGDANLLPASLPEMGRALRLAREQGALTIPEAANRAGLRHAEIEALENGEVGPQHDRIETLRTLKTYATSLGLPGNDYVLAAVEQWPAAGPNFVPHGDTAVVPVVSISSAPAGGHWPAGAQWPSDATGVADATTTGVFDAVHPAPRGEQWHDTGQVSIVDTGEVPAVRLGAPRGLKVLTWLVASLVVVGGVGLLEQDHVKGWAHDVRSSTAHWYDNAKTALGITSKPSGHTTNSATNAATNAATHPSSSTPGHTSAPPYKVVTDPSGQAATFNVPAPSFVVQVTAVNAPCWVQAVAGGNARPVFGQVLQAGQSHNFTVTSSSSMTIETGSAAGHAALYRGFKLLGSFVPAKTPFTMTFNATN